jgi:outer membrane protein assembly factor BamD
MLRLMTAPLLGLLLLSGCMKEPPNLAIVPPDDLYAQGAAYYQAEDYGDAISYLQVFVDNHFGDPRAPDARLMLGRAHVERNEFLSGIAHFQRLVNDYPRSPLQIDARFAICEAYNELSPNPPLDQEHTTSALVYCSSIPQYYPDSEQAVQAAGYVAKLREKLARKTYDAGMFYLRRGVGDAAVVYFEEVLLNFPEAAVAPAALARLDETYREMGYVEDADAARERLLREYPDSAEARGVGGAGEAISYQLSVTG